MKCNIVVRHRRVASFLRLDQTNFSPTGSRAHTTVLDGIERLKKGDGFIAQG